MGNSKINNARKEKNDEFYTRYEDIENELKHYTKHFKDKVVYCNCDDSSWSNFYKYFKDNFYELKLKKLISTNYDISCKNSFITTFDGVIEIKVSLIGDGDFRSDECLNILQEADIVITNPPFSLFRDFVSLVDKYKKSFLIVGHQNNISYKVVFKLIKENKLWLGYGFKGLVGFFINKHYENYASAKDKIDGMIRVSGVHWFTNMSIDKGLNKKLSLSKSYNEKDYPKYDNYDCIEVSKTKDIPIDYFGYMGVPISYLDKHNNEDFEILAMDDHRVLYPKSAKSNQIDGRNIYKRIIIKRRVKI